MALSEIIKQVYKNDLWDFHQPNMWLDVPFIYKYLNDTE